MDDVPGTAGKAEAEGKQRFWRIDAALDHETAPLEQACPNQLCDLAQVTQQQKDSAAFALAKAISPGTRRLHDSQLGLENPQSVSPLRSCVVVCFIHVNDPFRRPGRDSLLFYK